MGEHEFERLRRLATGAGLPLPVPEPVSPRAFCVMCVDGPASGYMVIQFVTPWERIKLMRNHSDMVANHGEWIHVPDDWFTDDLEMATYRRDELPTEVTDLTVTVEGDWLVRYEVVE